MKRLLGILLALALLGGSALAAEALPVGAFTRIGDGQRIDLDGDGSAETVRFRANNSDYGASYSLAVGNLSVDGEGDYLAEELYAVRFLNVEGAFLFVPDYGPSDDYASYVYHYIQDYEGAARLDDLGYVGGFPQYMAVTGPNTFTTYVRGNLLLTWFRPADFVIAAGYYYGDEFTVEYALAEVPRDIYPVGAHVTLRMDLPLMASRTDSTVVRTLRRGEQAIVAGSDDIEWVYIAAIDPEYGEAAGGWVRMDRDSYSTMWVGRKKIDAMDVMDGLLQAD